MGRHKTTGELRQKQEKMFVQSSEFQDGAIINQETNKTLATPLGDVLQLPKRDDKSGLAAFITKEIHSNTDVGEYSVSSEFKTPENILTNDRQELCGIERNHIDRGTKSKTIHTGVKATPGSRGMITLRRINLLKHINDQPVVWVPPATSSAIFSQGSVLSSPDHLCDDDGPIKFSTPIHSGIIFKSPCGIGHSENLFCSEISGLESVIYRNPGQSEKDKKENEMQFTRFLSFPKADRKKSYSCGKVSVSSFDDSSFSPVQITLPPDSPPETCVPAKETGETEQKSASGTCINSVYAVSKTMVKDSCNETSVKISENNSVSHQRIIKDMKGETKTCEQEKSDATSNVENRVTDYRSISRIKASKRSKAKLSKTKTKNGPDDVIFSGTLVKISENESVSNQRMSMETNGKIKICDNTSAANSNVENAAVGKGSGASIINHTTKRRIKISKAVFEDDPNHTVFSEAYLKLIENKFVNGQGMRQDKISENERYRNQKTTSKSRAGSTEASSRSVTSINDTNKRTTRRTKAMSKGRQIGMVCNEGNLDSDLTGCRIVTRSSLRTECPAAVNSPLKHVGQRFCNLTDLKSSVGNAKIVTHAQNQRSEVQTKESFDNCLKSQAVVNCVPEAQNAVTEIGGRVLRPRKCQSYKQHNVKPLQRMKEAGVHEAESYSQEMSEKVNSRNKTALVSGQSKQVPVTKFPKARKRALEAQTGSLKLSGLGRSDCGKSKGRDKTFGVLKGEDITANRIVNFQRGLKQNNCISAVKLKNDIAQGETSNKEDQTLMERIEHCDFNAGEAVAVAMRNEGNLSSLASFSGALKRNADKSNKVSKNRRKVSSSSSYADISPPKNISAIFNKTYNRLSDISEVMYEDIQSPVPVLQNSRTRYSQTRNSASSLSISELTLNGSMAKKSRNLHTVAASAGDMPASVSNISVGKSVEIPPKESRKRKMVPVEMQTAVCDKQKKPVAASKAKKKENTCQASDKTFISSQSNGNQEVDTQCPQQISKPRRKRKADLQSAVDEDVKHNKGGGAKTSQKEGDMKKAARKMQPKKTKAVPKNKSSSASEKESKKVGSSCGQEVDAKVKNQSQKFVGAHCSIAGGVSNAVTEALSIGARAFGLFVRNGRTWKLNPLDVMEAEKFKAACKEHGFPPHLILPHGSYLLNCGSSNPDTLKKSRDTLIHELQICELLGLTLYNFHPGSACGEGSTDDCLKVIAESINLAHQKTQFVKTVIENMSCQGQTVGGKLEELKAIIDNVTDKSRVGVCLDTCHAFAAGFDVSSKSGFNKFIEDFDRIVGLKYLCAMHLNDSKGELGCHLDRHENIGKGRIGIEGFRYIMNDPRLNNIPMILETPVNDYSKEIKVLCKLENL